jgi:hypothetical protein
LLTFIRIVIEHDNSGFGAAWFLDKVIIESGKGEKWYFPSGKWLADDEDDKQIRREISAVKEDSSTYLPLVKYKVTVLTGDRWGAGTDSDVFITVYGDEGISPETKLDNAQNNFERAKTDVFGIEAASLGEIKKIRIRTDGSGIGADWFLDKVNIHCEKDNKDYFFLFGKWFDSKNGISHEIPASDKDGVCTLPLKKYKVSVTTGDRFGAGTDANVFITIYGSNGDSGERLLDGPGNNFERNQVDVFQVEAVDLGEISKIRVRHDDSGIGPGWFLEKVVLEQVTDDGTGKQWFFLCGKWLDKGQDDGSISREISAADKDGKASLPMVSYKISVTTGDRRGAGTDANVFVKIFGDLGDSGDHKLESPGNNFERNQIDVFGIQCVDLGELQKIQIWHDNSGISAGWFLDKVVVDSGKGVRWYFPCGKWLADDEDDKKISRELPAVKEDSANYIPMATYRVTVITGDRWGAGTDANVFITLFGANSSKSDESKLDNAQDNFERNKTDVFGVESVHLGDLSKVIIRTDGSGIGSDWFLDKITVFSEKDNKSWFFLCGDWLNSENGNLKEMVAASEDGTSCLPLAKYKIEVETGDRRGAGTDANVYIEISGDKGTSGRRTLDGAATDLFERAHTDVFGIEAVDLGELTKIRIGHDNSGFGPGWFLEKVAPFFPERNSYLFFRLQLLAKKTKNNGSSCVENGSTKMKKTDKPNAKFQLPTKTEKPVLRSSTTRSL